tara:strand:- start:1571 stop:2059 length:489 start_codon:yes stop_codon:yes gene_type:complete
MGGGVLPVALHNGQVLFLLGKESSRRGGWSDFGGSKEGRETPRQTAIREGAEELDGFFGTGRSLSERVRDNHLVTVRIRGFATYLFQVPYDPYLPGYFAGHHALMRKNLADKVGRRGMFEKSEVAWFTPEQLRSSFHVLRPFYREVAASILRSLPRISSRLR